MSFAGLKANQRRRGKYYGCEYERTKGRAVRLLSPMEIKEFQAHIAKVMAAREAR